MARAPRAPATAQRNRILEAVKTPLGFFVLALLVIEATFLPLAVQSGQDKLSLFMAYVVAIVALALIVALLAYFGVFAQPSSPPPLKIPTYSIVVGFPKDLRALDIRRVVWDKDKCTLTIGEKVKKSFTPAYPADPQGATLEVRISSNDYVMIDEHSVIELTFADDKGNIWDVTPFRLWQTDMQLRLRSDRQKILQDYPDENAGQ